MAALRGETGYHDEREGAWLWCAGRSVFNDRACCREVSGTWRPRNNLRWKPFVGAAVDKVLELMEKEHLTEHVKEIAPYLEKRLDELVEKYDFLTARRGMGLMQGIVCEKPVGQVSAKALEEGLILITAGSDVLRIVPPLIIEKEHVDEMVEKLEKVFQKMK